MNVVSFEAEVNDYLVNSIIFFIFTFQVVIHDSIGLGLRIGYN